MKTITTSVLGVEVPVTDAPENLQELIAAFGGEDGVYNSCMNYIRFHRTNTEARAEVADRIQAVTGIERKSKTVKAPTKANPNATRDEWDETENEYSSRAIAEFGDKGELFRQVLQGGFKNEDGSVAEPLSVKFSVQGAPREAGPRKVAQVYTKAAQELIDKGTVDKAIATLQGFGIQVQLGEDGKPTIESLATALKANRERVEKEANAALGLA